MTVALSAAIMAHPKRAAFVEELQGKLSRDVVAVWDHNNDRWETGVRTMTAYAEEATHHLVLQDDAVIPRDFLAGVHACLEAAPAEALESPVCLYVGKSGRYRHLREQIHDGVSWLTMETLNWGVAVVFPTATINEAVRWGHDRSDVPNWDKRLSRFYQHIRRRIWYTWPSLVDHRESPSLVQGRGYRGRTAQRFLGADVSAMDVDWSGAVVTVEPFGTGRVHLGGSGTSGSSIVRNHGSPTPASPGQPAHRRSRS